MKHLNYFLALVPAGSFALLGVLGSVLSLPIDLVAFALGVSPNSETAKLVGNFTVAILWSMVLAGFWIRHRGLSPKFVKAGHAFTLLGGHLCLIAGHAIVLCMFLVKSFGDLMILPAVGVLFFYAAGIALIELSRDRLRSLRGEA